MVYKFENLIGMKIIINCKKQIFNLFNRTIQLTSDADKKSDVLKQ